MSSQHLVVSDIPESWVNLLKAIQEKDPKAFIAGGCLRDLDLKLDGCLINDIDVFVCSGDEDKWAVGEWESFQTIAPPVFGDPDSAENNDTISGQARIMFLNVEYPVNLLFCRKDVEPATRFPHFDFGLVQIAFDGERVYFTDAYLTDKQNKTFTLLRNSSPEGYQSSLDRYQRFIKRPIFENYKLVNKFIDDPPTIKRP